MTKDEWIAAAAAKLQPHLGVSSQGYAESLYQTYVEEDGEEWASNPEGAVAEDMNYWDED